jgi:non-specific protein-tyrosine kinase
MTSTTDWTSVAYRRNSPIGDCNGSGRLSSFVESDGLMSRVRKATSAQVTLATKVLRSVDARLLGCVLNLVPAKGPDAYYHYGEYSSRNSKEGPRGRPDSREEPPRRTDHRRRPFAGAVVVGSIKPIMRSMVDSASTSTAHAARCCQAPSGVPK